MGLLSLFLSRARALHVFEQQEKKSMRSCFLLCVLSITLSVWPLYVLDMYRTISVMGKVGTSRALGKRRGLRCALGRLFFPHDCVVICDWDSSCCHVHIVPSSEAYGYAYRQITFVLIYFRLSADSHILAPRPSTSPYERSLAHRGYIYTILVTPSLRSFFSSDLFKPSHAMHRGLMEPKTGIQYSTHILLQMHMFLQQHHYPLGCSAAEQPDPSFSGGEIASEGTRGFGSFAGFAGSAGSAAARTRTGRDSFARHDSEKFAEEGGRSKGVSRGELQ